MRKTALVGPGGKTWPTPPRIKLQFLHIESCCMLHEACMQSVHGGISNLSSIGSILPNLLKRRLNMQPNECILPHWIRRAAFCTSHAPHFLIDGAG